MRFQVRGEKPLGEQWRAGLQRALRLELSRYDDLVERVIVTVREDRALCVELVLAAGTRLDFTTANAADPEAVAHLAQQAGRSLSHLVHSSNFRMVS